MYVLHLCIEACNLTWNCITWNALPQPSLHIVYFLWLYITLTAHVYAVFELVFCYMKTILQCSYQHAYTDVCVCVCLYIYISLTEFKVIFINHIYMIYKYILGVFLYNSFAVTIGACASLYNNCIYIRSYIFFYFTFFPLPNYILLVLFDFVHVLNHIWYMYWYTSRITSFMMISMRTNPLSIFLSNY